MILAFLFCTSSKTIVISSGDTSVQSEPSSVSDPSEPADIPETDEGLCEDAPAVTWDNWARSLFITHCQGCHASSSPNRYGAPEDIHFDHESATIDQADRIWIRVIEEENMPPAGGILEDDLYLLDIWLRCTVDL